MRKSDSFAWGMQDDCYLNYIQPNWPSMRMVDVSVLLLRMVTDGRLWMYFLMNQGENEAVKMDERKY
ncbi:MAG: hypothetical protein ACLTML_09635 [Blautia faecis]